MLTYAADEQEASADKRYGARADYREYKESVSNLIPFPPSLFRPLPLAVKRIFFFEWPMYSEGLKPLALEQGGEEGEKKDGGRGGEGGPGDGEGEIEESRRVQLLKLAAPQQASLEQLQEPFIVRTLPPSHAPPPSLIVSPPLSQSVYFPQQVQPVYVIHPKP
jgi:hypothetical protein